MFIVLKYQLFQLYNFWRYLGLRIQVEIIILFVIFYAYFSNKLIAYFNQLAEQPNVSQWGLSGFIVHILLIIALVIAPFIYFHLIPRQRSLTALFTQPVSQSQALFSLLFLYFKYELMILMFLAPVFTALFLTTGVLPALYGIAVFLFLPVYSIIFIYYLSIKSDKKSFVLWRYFFFITGYFCVYFYLYWQTNLAVYADLLIILISYFILRKIWIVSWYKWDETIARLIPLLDRSTRALSGIGYSDFSFIKLHSFRPLYIKDFLSQIRNKHYLRLKAIGLLVFIAALFIVKIFFYANLLPALSAFSIVLIWEHYSHQFNEKYSMREPRYFYKVLPISYFQVVFSKFISEFLYIIIIVLILFVFLIIQQMPVVNILVFLGMVIIVSAFILYLMILVRILFHDNPRFAGYAYHIMLIFTAVMTLNFYLVGPVITIGILIHLNIKSYRQFMS